MTSGADTVAASDAAAQSGDGVPSRWAIAVGAALIVGAVAVRLWGLGWGLPYAYHSDEPVNLTTTLTMLRDGDPNPHSFIYPGLFYYTHAAGQLAYYGVGAATGNFDSISEISTPEAQTLANARLGNPNSMLTGRLVSLAFSVGTVAVVFFVVLAVARSLGGAALAGFVTAFAPLAVRRGRLLTPDPIAMFFTAAVLAASFLVLRRGRRIDYMVAGALVGLAGASKYHVALVAIVVLAAHIMRTGLGFAADGKIYLAGGVAMATFIVVSPFALLDFSEFWAEFSSKTVHYQEGHSGAEGGSLAFYGRTLLAEYGLLMLLTPFGFVAHRFRREAALAAGFAVAYIGFISLFVVRFDRHLLPVLPAVAVLIGFGLTGLLVLLRRRFGSTRLQSTMAAVLVGVVVVLGIALPLIETIDDGVRYSSDERGEAREWIQRSLPADSTVLVDAYSPFVDPKRYRVTRASFAAIDGGDPSNYDYVIVAEQGSGRFLAEPSLYPSESARYQERFGSFCEVALFEDVVWTRVLGRDC